MKIRMARQKQLWINLKMNYPNAMVDIGKIVLGERSRKKTSGNKRQQKDFSIAACALLKSGGAVVRMESEDKNRGFGKHGIGRDTEQVLGACTETGQHFTGMQQQRHSLLLVKTWSCRDPEQKSAATKLRTCSLSTGLSRRSFTSVVSLTPSDTAVFLREKESCAEHCDESGPSAKRALLNFDGGAKESPLSTEEHHIQDAAAKFAERDKLMAGEVLDFTETTRIEFKNFSTESILEHIRKTLPKYVSAFANTQGGYFFFGVDDESHKVIGSHSKVERKALVKTVADTMGSMPVHHFCGSQAGTQFQTYVLSIYEEAGGLQGYVCAVVEPLCCAVFHDNPDSRMATDAAVERLSVRKWTEFLTHADPGFL
ncbi:LOW QUALITY PROTEIN: protein SLFN14-like [Alca torda]